MQENRDRFYLLFMTALSLIPVIAVFTPRFLAFGPTLLGLIAGLYWLYGRKEKIVFSKPYMFWILALGALWAISALWSADPTYVLEKTVKTIPLLLTGVFIISLPRALDPEKIRPYLWIFPACVTAACLLTALELAFDMPVYRLLRGIGAEETIGTAVMNRSVVSLVLCSFASMALIFAWNGTKEIKIRRAVLLVLSILAMLIWTESQTGQITFAVGLITALVFPYRHRIFYPALSVLIGLLLLATPWLAQFMFAHLAAESAHSAWLSEGYAANRMEIWDFVSRYALQAPLHGHGLEATRMVESFGDHFFYHDKPSVLHPHNFAVQLWVEFGLPGALFGAGFLAFLIGRIGRLDKPQAQIALPTLLSALTAAAISYGLWQGWWLGEFIFLIALCRLAVHTAQTGNSADTKAPPEPT